METKIKNESLVERLRSTAARREKSLLEASAIIRNSTKSNDSYLKTIFLLQGRAIHKFSVPLTICTLNSIIWTLLIKTRFKDSFEIPSEPWASLYTLVLTTSLAFLLVFRLNRVAIRWWDTREKWGMIVAHTRILVEAASIHCDHDKEHRDEAVRWTAGFLIAVKEHMRKNKDQMKYPYDQLAGFLNEDEVDQMLNASHPCLYASRKIRFALNQAFKITPNTPTVIGMNYASQFRIIEKSINKLIEMMGGLERVRSTPLPIAFVTHLRTFIMFYLMSLPYLYGHSWGYGTIPAVFFTAYALLGIDGSASECESPFDMRPNHLNMEAFCLTTMNDILQLLPENDSYGNLIAEQWEA